MARDRILFALTSHGLGHLTRSLAVARALRELHPAASPVVATTVPRERVARDLPAPFAWRPVAYEPGTLQRSAFETDVEATRVAYRRWREAYPQRLHEECAFLRESGCRGVVADVPALAVRAAAEVGLPVVAVANFTWDWILAPLLRGSEVEGVAEELAADYRRGTAHLRLPFGPETSPFARSEPAPLVSRRATLEPADVRSRLGLPRREEARLVVVCPGGWEPEGWAPIHVAGCRDFRFVTVGDLPVRAEAPLTSLPHDLPEGIAFTDLVAAADVVLAKPGYGMASECLAHRTALVAIERPDFRETPLLLERFRREGACEELSLADFFAGRWEPSLRAAAGAEAAWPPVPADGARRVAERIVALLELG